MTENKIVKLSYFVKYDFDCEITIGHPAVQRVYSYIMYANYVDNKLYGFDIEYNVSQTDRLNTLSVDEIVQDIKQRIAELIKQNEVKYVIGYKQPNIDLQYELFQPYIRKLASELYNSWNTDYEYDDVVQICNMVMVILYNKGYYINNQLLRKSVINYILMDLRKERDKPEMVSLESRYYAEDTSIALEETIADKVQTERQEDEENLEYLDFIMKQKRELIVDLIGQRQYDQLVREYGTKTVSGRGRQQVNKLKVELEHLGINSRTFHRGLR